MTLRERMAVAAERAGTPVCGACGTRHSGAAWSPALAWHDPQPARTHDLRGASWVDRARTRTLPARVE